MVSTSVELAREALDGKITGIAKDILGDVAHAALYNSDATTTLNPILRIYLLRKPRSPKVKFVVRMDRFTAGNISRGFGYLIIEPSGKSLEAHASSTKKASTARKSPSIFLPRQRGCAKRDAGMRLPEEPHAGFVRFTSAASRKNPPMRWRSGSPTISCGRRENNLLSHALQHSLGLLSPSDCFYKSSCSHLAQTMPHSGVENVSVLTRRPLNTVRNGSIVSIRPDCK
jgi:hypothetical protein